jgi:hypothetical protein
MNKNLYRNGFILIFKIYFHTVRGTPSQPPLAAHRLVITCLETIVS